MNGNANEWPISGLATACALSAAMALASACGVPRGECTGGLIYLDGSCRRCPAEARFDDALGTCVCTPEEAYEYQPDNTCALRPGAKPPVVERPDAGGSEDGPQCMGYCGFVDGCLAQNAAAAAAASSVIAELGVADGDDSACLDGCQAFAGEQPDDTVAACVAAGRVKAACDDLDDLSGIQKALGLLDSCCAGAPGSALCASICEALTGSPVAASMVHFCP